MTQNRYLYILENLLQMKPKLCVLGYNVHCDHSKGLHPKALHSFYGTSSALMSAQAYKEVMEGLVSYMISKGALVF